MPSEDRLDALAERLRQQLRARGRDAIGVWLDSFDAPTGNVLLLKAPTGAKAIIEVGFQTTTWSH